MQRVPDAGYKIIGLPVAGFDRKRLWKNFAVIIKLLRSQLKARRILKEFHPQVAVGVGSYDSSPMLKVADMMGVPTLIQEQNSYAGVTNKLLAQKACKICVAYDGMEKFFPADKIIMTGNPVRQNLLANKQSREAAVTSFGFNPEKKTILILGGSLGARTIGQTGGAALGAGGARGGGRGGWQTGKIYIQQVKDAITTTTGEAVRNPRISAIPNLYVTDFIKDMASAYAAADLVVSRSGACTVSELCLVAKPTLFVPSPNVAEDHQTKNARALADKGAALLIPDSEAVARAMDEAVGLLKDPVRLAELSRNIEALAIPDSAERIVNEIEKQLPQSK